LLGKIISPTCAAPDKGIKGLKVRLGAAGSNPWQGVDRIDVVATIVRVAGNKNAANILDVSARFTRLQKIKAATNVVRQLVCATGQSELY